MQLQLLQFKRILHIIHCAHTVLCTITMADKPIAQHIHQQHWIWIQIWRIKCDLLLLDDATSTVSFVFFPAFIRKHQSLFGLALFVSVSCVTFFQLFINMYAIFYTKISILLILFRFWWCFFAHTLLHDMRRMCFISNYFTINLQMHLYNGRSAWASLYCSTCQKHCLGILLCIGTNVKMIAPHKLWFPI